MNNTVNLQEGGNHEGQPGASGNFPKTALIGHGAAIPASPACRERLQLLSMAIEQAGEVVVITDADGRIEYVNPAFEQTTGYTAAEAVGQTPRLLKSGVQDGEFYRRLWQTISSGKTWKGRLVNRRKNGSHYTEQATISPVRDATGNIVNFVGVKGDISEFLLMEERLRQAQKLEAIAMLAGGVAHDFNNQLVAVLGYADMLAEKLTDTVFKQYAERIRTAAKRSADLTKKLLAFSRQGQYRLQMLDLHLLLQDVASSLPRGAAGQPLQVRQELCATNPRIMGDAAQLKNALQQLAVNALDAMPAGGLLTVSTTNENFERSITAGSGDELPPGNYLVITVRDNGRGMNGEVLARAFDPFFTTKDKAGGHGMGLPAVHGIMKQHNGLVTLTSEPGRGTEAKIYLPALRVEAVPDRAALAAPSPKRRILVIDDEEQVRLLTSTMLTAAGHEVHMAADGSSGLEIYRSKEPGYFDLVLVDMTMPGMGGGEVLQELRRLNPAVRAILASGYTLNGDTNGITGLGFQQFLNKPYTLKELLACIKATLGD